MVRHWHTVLTSDFDFISKFFSRNSKGLPEFSCNEFYPKMERRQHLVLPKQLLVRQGKQQISEKQGTGGGFQGEKVSPGAWSRTQCSELKCEKHLLFHSVYVAPPASQLLPQGTRAELSGKNSHRCSGSRATHPRETPQNTALTCPGH